MGGGALLGEGAEARGPVLRGALGGLAVEALQQGKAEAGVGEALFADHLSVAIVAFDRAPEGDGEQFVGEPGQRAVDQRIFPRLREQGIAAARLVEAGLGHADMGTGGLDAAGLGEGINEGGHAGRGPAVVSGGALAGCRWVVRGWKD